MDTEISNAVDAAVARLAHRAYGNVTRTQLIALGLDDRAIAWRVGEGRLFPVDRAVYAVGRPPRTPLERAAAAVLACGPGAALSHEGALALWRFTTRWPQRFDVMLPAGDRRPRTITTHHCRNLLPRDLTVQRGIPTTSPARSPLEDDFVAFCARHGLPKPETNVTVAGHTVDVLFREQRLIVEIDSWQFHKDREAFETDRTRDADTLQAGFRTIRLTDDRMKHNGDAEAARLHQILSAPPAPRG